MYRPAFALWPSQVRGSSTNIPLPSIGTPPGDDASSLIDAPNQPINLWLFLYKTSKLLSKLTLGIKSSLNIDPQQTPP